VRPLPLAHDAAAARLALIAHAQRSIDLQTFLLADDGVGHLMLRARRDAARRGVRVRVLLVLPRQARRTETLTGHAARTRNTEGRETTARSET
jgi:phosphatidylserine/phosphatidylglycerophosphate/cardiolipin synthase-like enzyme